MKVYLLFTKKVYPIKSRFISGNFPGSLSGSETDISTSNENLSHEERYVIQHTTRQEPQGQENRSSQDCTSYNTLIIHGKGDEKVWNNRY